MTRPNCFQLRLLLTHEIFSAIFNQFRHLSEFLGSYIVGTCKYEQGGGDEDEEGEKNLVFIGVAFAAVDIQ